ncbi:MAG TPA: hypothetical protein VNU95_16290 [Candidatus Acidoferrales bacterium]|jgi:hypothetical protein|nr:hypothetical protein [Candidatus Acidoferrales bacterium]
MNDDAVAKIAMLRGSFRCFVYGALGLLPIIGLPFAFNALWSAGRIRVMEKKYWNAARSYRLWGGACAFVGILSTLGGFALFALIMINVVYGH